MVDSALLPPALLDVLALPLILLNADKHCIYISESLATGLGFARREGEALPIETFWPGAAKCDLAGVETLAQLRAASGELISVKLALHHVGAITLVRVIAGVSSAEAVDAFHTQRVQTLGMLAGGVAHDFNNILAGILGHITYLKTILPGRGAHTESLTAIEEGARKASGMTQQILNFSRLDGSEGVAQVELGLLATRSCSLLRGALSPEYLLQCTVPDERIAVLASEAKLGQVIMNLVINARDASAPGDQISVHLTRETNTKAVRDAFGIAELPATRYACLAVADQGHGMSPEVIERIFEPYFSTKKEKGTGLGLSTVASIVRHCGGAITISSCEGEGTTVCVYLPLVDSAVESPGESDQNHPQLAGGDERILVIDDESPVRNVLSLSLQHLGYHVEVACSGNEGIDCYSQRDGGFDLVILDMLMPLLPGNEVFFRLQKLDPGVKVLLISGYSSESAVKSVLTNGGLGFLQKPFTIDELSKKVRDCLDRG